MNKSMIGNILVILFLCAITIGIYFVNNNNICGTIISTNEYNSTVTIKSNNENYPNILVDKLTLNTIKNNVNTNFNMCYNVGEKSISYWIVNFVFLILTIVYLLRVLGGFENENIE